jgi:hypothetical protein
VEDPTNFPFSYFLRNTRTGEIMFYNARSGDRGELLTIPIEGRAVRDSSPGEGQADDPIELVSPLDIFVESYDPLLGAAIIAREDSAPEDADFTYPDPTDDPQYSESFTLDPGDILTVWLRRFTPAGASALAEIAYRLSFKFDDV